MMNARLLFVHALSPLHAGTGQGVGVIDLPIAREKATGLPYLPGSSLKGTLRDACGNGPMCKKVFGPDTNNADEHSGSVQVSDQRLLLLPIRSLAGTFAWVTSPYVLRRLARDTEAAGLTMRLPRFPSPAENGCLVSDQDCKITVRITVNNQQINGVVLEDIDLAATTDETTRTWAEWVGDQIFPNDHDWQGMLKARICVVCDDVLSFLLDTATEITARIKLREDAKTVKKGGLWYEESLPTETILSGLVVATPTQKVSISTTEVFQTLEGLLTKAMQFGGKSTVGRGLCRLQLTGGN